MATAEQSRILEQLDVDGLRPFVVPARHAYGSTEHGDLLGIRPCHEFGKEGQYLLMSDGKAALYWCMSNLRGAIQVRRYKFSDIEHSVILTREEFSDLVLGWVVITYKGGCFGTDWLDGDAA